MSLTLSFTGTLRFNPTDGAAPCAIPVSFSTPYTQKSEQSLVYPAPITHLRVASGSITNPRFVMIEVTDGTVEFSLDSGGANPFTLSVEDSPAPADTAKFFMYTYSPEALALYATSTGPSAFTVSFFF